MESDKTPGSWQQIIDEFKKWLKKFHELLSTKNRTRKTCFNVKQQINKDLINSIEEMSNNSHSTSAVSMDIIPYKIQTQLVYGVNNLKIKSEQLSNCSETMTASVEEETTNIRNKFYTIITKDEVFLKPFHEVEEAIKELTQTAEYCMTKLNADRNFFLKNLKERELDYTEMKHNIIIMESIEQALRPSINKHHTNFEQELKYLNVNSIEEANRESNESKELLADISNMKIKLNLK